MFQNPTQINPGPRTVKTAVKRNTLMVAPIEVLAAASRATTYAGIAAIDAAAINGPT
jgi:hypothetical protein